jgi:hypothetical protein
MQLFLTSIVSNLLTLTSLALSLIIRFIVVDQSPSNDRYIPSFDNLADRIETIALGIKPVRTGQTAAGSSSSKLDATNSGLAHKVMLSILATRPSTSFQMANNLFPRRSPQRFPPLLKLSPRRNPLFHSGLKFSEVRLKD